MVKITSILLCVSFMVSISDGVFAQGNEEITLSTYYPAPYGEYEELSVEKSLLPPRMSTSERDAISSPTAGSVIYNTTTNMLEIYNGGGWIRVGSGTSALGQYQPKSKDTVYEATSDGFVLVYLTAGGNTAGKIRAIGYADNNNLPTTPRQAAVAQNRTDEPPGGPSTEVDMASFIMPVPKGQYWKVWVYVDSTNSTHGIYWIALAS